MLFIDLIRVQSVGVCVCVCVSHIWLACNNLIDKCVFYVHFYVHVYVVCVRIPVCSWRVLNLSVLSTAEMRRTTQIMQDCRSAKNTNFHIFISSQISEDVRSTEVDLHQPRPIMHLNEFN